MALLVIAVREPIPSAATLVRIPWWAWSGGAFGAMIFLGLMLERALRIVNQMAALGAHMGFLPGILYYLSHWFPKAGASFRA